MKGWAEGQDWKDGVMLWVVVDSTKDSWST